MVWAESGASVIEFPLTPHVNRNMGFLAMACMHEYYLLPQLTTQFNSKYTATPDAIHAAVNLVTHILRKSGWEGAGHHHTEL